MEHADRKFRMAQTVFMFAAGMVLCLLLMLQYQSQRNFQLESAARAKDILELQRHNDAQNDKQLAKQTRYIKCIAHFFASKDRANRQLTDLDSCTIEPTTAAAPTLDLPAIGSLYPSSTDYANTLPTGDSGGSKTDEGGRLQGPAADSPSPPAPPQQSAPFEVFGIPACVPFTQICVR